MNLLARVAGQRRAPRTCLSRTTWPRSCTWPIGSAWSISGACGKSGPAEAVFAPPFHPYTEALLSALPIPDPDAQQERIRLPGSVPSAVNIPTGCRFHTRCPRKIGEICETQEPPWQDAGNEHRICCHIPLAELRSLQDETS